MFPIEIPPGTTIETLLTKVIPETHARFAADDGKEEIRASLRVIGGDDYTLSVRGKSARVERGDAKDAAVRVSVTREAVELFLEDWSTTRRFVPTYVPAGGLVVLTDPRVLRRVVMVSGHVEVAISDFPREGRTERVAMRVGAGAAAKKGIDADPDAVVEAESDVVARVLAGKLAPEDAIAGGHVKLTGKKLVAMQFAFAIAPFYAPKS